MLQAGDLYRVNDRVDVARKLYDDVVSEPLPDSFEDLLRRLDQAGND